MEKKDSTKKAATAKRRTIQITEDYYVTAPKRLNKYGKWLLAMEGKPGYIIIKDEKAVLK